MVDDLFFKYFFPSNSIDMDVWAAMIELFEDFADWRLSKWLWWCDDVDGIYIVDIYLRKPKVCG